jgi:hypothetical protein
MDRKGRPLMPQKKEPNFESVNITRRKFFPLLVREVFSIFEELKGKPQRKISDLPNLPDDVVRKIVPVFNREKNFNIKDNVLNLRNKKTGENKEIYVFDSEEKYIFELFDKGKSLEEIGNKAAEKFGTEDKTAYRKTRSLFLSLSKFLICFPSEPYD